MKLEILTNRNSKITVGYKVATLLLWVTVLFIQCYQIFKSPISFDDAWMANISKAWLQGPGMGLIIYDKFYPFHNMGLNSIFAFFGAGALAIGAFGNVYWAPALAGVILIQILLIACFFALRSLPGMHEKLWPVALSVLLLWLMTTTGDYIHRPEHSFLWYSFHGDIPSALSVVLIVLLLARDHVSKRDLVLIGGMAGIATQIKLLTILPFTVICISVFLHVVKEKPLKHAVCSVLLLIAGLVFVTLLCELYTIYCLGFSDFVAIGKKNLDFIFANAANTHDVANHAVLLQHDSKKSAGLLWLFVGIILLPALYVIICLSLLSILLDKSRDSSVYAGTCLLFCGIVQCVWWVFFSVEINRYLAPAMMYILAGIVLILINRSKIYPLSLYALLIIVAFGRGEDTFAFFKEGFRTHPSLAAMFQAKDTLEQLQRNGYPLAACGMNFEMEYLMTGNRHFIPCDTMTPGKDKFAVLLTFIRPSEIAYYSAYEDFVKLGPPPDWIMQKCSPAFPSAYFAVWTCDKVTE